MAISNRARTRRWHVDAAFAAWLLPGLGHYLLGLKQRGLILGIAIGLLWVAGCLIGGIGGFDHHRWWFLGQMLVGPSVVVDQVHHRLRRQSLPNGPLPARARFEPPFGRTEEQGFLYTSLAGLLNLMAIIDVLYREPIEHR